MSKRELKALVAAGMVAMFGLAGCSAGPGGAEATQVSSSEGGMSVQEACKLLTTQSMEVLRAARLVEDDDSEKILQSQSILTNAYKEVADAVGDPEFKELALQTYELAVKRDELEWKQLVDQDRSVGPDAIQALTEYLESSK